MALVVQIDALSTVEQNEVNGIIMRMVRQAQATGLTPAIAPVMVDEVLTELDNQGLINGAVLAGHNNLLLRHKEDHKYFS